MRNCAGLAALAVAVVASVAGCTKQNGSTPSVAQQSKDGPKISFNFPISACSGGTTPNPSESYGIEIGPNFKLDSPAVKLTYPGNRPKKGTYRPKQPTKLDIATDLANSTQPGTVTITLKKNSNLTFATGGMAFSGGDSNSSSIFCGPNVAKNTSGEDTLTFTVLPHAGAASYILGLVAADSDPNSADVLPILIDPIVDNNGVDFIPPPPPPTPAPTMASPHP